MEQGHSAGQPNHGYYFKVLKGQGPAPPMGEMDFVVNGAMIGGFALAAAPAKYRVTGVKTFVGGPENLAPQPLVLSGSTSTGRLATEALQE